MKLLIIEDDVIDCKNFINAIENRKDNMFRIYYDMLWKELDHEC